MIRAFDSYSSTDSGSTWTAPTTQRPQLPASSTATTPNGDVPLFKKGSTTTYAQTVSDVVGSTSTNILWELDGYSAYAAGQPDTSASGSTPQVWWQADYSSPTVSGSSNYNANYPKTGGSLPFNGYTQGPGYYGKTFFLWPPDPRTITVPSGSTLTGYLNALGITNSTDQSTLSTMWPTWQGQGATGLNNLQNWMKQGSKASTGASNVASTNYYTSNTKVPGFTTWNGTTLATANQPSTYFAVCRLFNRAYPGGAAWTSTSFSADWRARFFGMNAQYGNTYLFNSSGSLNALGSYGTWPGSGSVAASSQLTYNAILQWLNQSPDPFPTQMRAGRIKYYGSIPTQITGSWPSYGSTDQRFWKELIDYVLGFYQTSSSGYQDVSAMAGYGSDFTWGTMTLNTPPAAPQYMKYSDNPLRPKMRFWFGPMMMVDYLHNYNMWENVGPYYFMQPGDSYEAPLYTGKQAYLAAITTMQTNNPNDWFTLVPYSWPRTAASTVYGRFNCVACPLGTNYNYASAALLFPFSTINADGSCNNTEVTPYDSDPQTGNIPSANFMDTGRPDGDTCFAMALMHCYNQFAVTPSTDTTLRGFVTNTPITFPTAMAGGMGRKGAQKVIVFETDGMPNCSATANLVTASAGYNYYQIRYDMNKPSSSEYPSITTADINDPNVLSQVYSLVSQLQSTYNSSRNPFRLYGIGFGPVFQGPDATSAQTTLQTMQYYAGTQSSIYTPLPSNQIITGNDATMSANVISTFTSILQNGVQIALIK